MANAGKVALGCVIAALALLILSFGIFALGWFGFIVSKASPENVQTQWTFAYEYNNSLRATATQACAMQKAVDAETDSQAKTQRRDQLNAIILNYARIEAQYDAALQNAFKAKYIKPNDVPTTAPTLAEEEAVVCTPG